MPENPAPAIPAAAVVLAGGQSRRMGRDKAGLPLGDSTILARVLARLLASFAEVILAPGRSRDDVPRGVRVVPDALEGAGPVGGLLAGLAASSLPRVYLWACDMPFPRPAVARRLLEIGTAYDVIAPRTSRGIERFGAFYATGIRAAIEHAASRGRYGLLAFWPRVRVFLAPEESWRSLDPVQASARNVNTPEEYEALRAELGF